MMLTLLGFVATPLGRIAAGLALAAVLAGGLYLKGRGDGRAACIGQGERDVLHTIERADRARADSDRRTDDAGRLRDDDAFRRD